MKPYIFSVFNHQGQEHRAILTTDEDGFRVVTERRKPLTDALGNVIQAWVPAVAHDSALLISIAVGRVAQLRGISVAELEAEVLA